MPVAWAQNTQAKPRERMIIVLMRAGSEYCEIKISGLSNLGYDVSRQRGPAHLFHDDPAIVIKQLEHHPGSP